MTKPELEERLHRTGAMLKSSLDIGDLPQTIYQGPQPRDIEAVLSITLGSGTGVFSTSQSTYT